MYCRLGATVMCRAPTARQPARLALQEATVNSARLFHNHVRLGLGVAPALQMRPRVCLAHTVHPLLLSRCSARTLTSVGPWLQRRLYVRNPHSLLALLFVIMLVLHICRSTGHVLPTRLCVSVGVQVRPGSLCHVYRYCRRGVDTGMIEKHMKAGLAHARKDGYCLTGYHAELTVPAFPRLRQRLFKTCALLSQQPIARIMVSVSFVCGTLCIAFVFCIHLNGCFQPVQPGHILAS